MYTNLLQQAAGLKPPTGRPNNRGVKYDPAMQSDIPIHHRTPHKDLGISHVMHLFDTVHKRKREDRPSEIIKEEKKNILQTEKEPTRIEVLEAFQDISAEDQNAACIRVKNPKVPAKRRRRK